MSDYPTERGMRSNQAQQDTGTGTGTTYGAGTDTYGTGTDTYGTGTGTTYNTNTGANTGTNTQGSSTTTGHHKHDFLHKLDPRANSAHDRQPRHGGGSHTTGGEGRERFHASATAGPQIGGTDPSFGPGATGVATTDEGAGVGGAVAAGSSTGLAGAVPLGHAHKSEFLNKLDPRVDSKTGAWKPRRGSGGSGGPVA